MKVRPPVTTFTAGHPAITVILRFLGIPVIPESKASRVYCECQETVLTRELLVYEFERGARKRWEQLRWRVIKNCETCCLRGTPPRRLEYWIAGRTRKAKEEKPFGWVRSYMNSLLTDETNIMVFVINITGVREKVQLQPELVKYNKNLK